LYALELCCGVGIVADNPRGLFNVGWRDRSPAGERDISSHDVVVSVPATFVAEHKFDALVLEQAAITSSDDLSLVRKHVAL
jgi:hypothetical protein